MTTYEQILQARSGNVEVRNRIILDNMGLVKKIANRHFELRSRFDDSVQSGIFGILAAIEKFDPMKGTWVSYLGLWIHRTMQERTGTKEFTILNEAASRQDSDSSTDLYGMDQRVTMKVDELSNTKDETHGIWLREAINTLSARERNVIDLLYFHDATTIEVAKLFDLSQQMVSKIHRTALAKLRAVLQPVKG